MNSYKKDVPLRNTFAVIVFTLWFVIGLLFAFILPLSSFTDINMKIHFNNYPRLVVIFHGLYMSVTGLLILIFRNEFGMWSAQIRKKIGDTFPAWKKMSGLPEEKVQYYLSFEFNRRMAVFAAILLIVLGIVFSMLFLSFAK